MIGALPALLVPTVGPSHFTTSRGASGSLLSAAIVLWLACATAGGAAVAAIEIGAVALAMSFGYEPALAIMFTVPLCLASVAGGIWASARNRMATRKGVLVQLSLMAAGSAFVALHHSVATTVMGAVLVGSVLAPMATYYSLILDSVAAAQRRAEVFALLR